jgi:hypothetical protein
MSNAVVKRDAYGHLLPGSRLNPGGRPRSVIEDVRERLGPYTPEFVAALVELVRSPNEAIRLAAIREALDRLLGKPAVAVAVNNTVEHDIRQLYLKAVMAANQEPRPDAPAGPADPDVPADSAPPDDHGHW